MTKIAVILSGCGVYDGTEIHEAVLTLLAIESYGATYSCFAPNIMQTEVVDHIEVAPSNDARNVLVESARLARGKVADLASLDVNDFNAVIIPGGFGVAKNLSTFANLGKDMEINEEVFRVCSEFKQQKKLAGYLCVSPILLPLIYGNTVKYTVGSDIATVDVLLAMGGKHIECAADDIIFDEVNKVVTTPAYMLAQSLVELQTGINKLVKVVINGVI